MAKRSLDIVIAGHNKTHRAFTSAGTALNTLKSQVLSFRNIAVGGLGIYGITRGMRAAVTSSTEFERKMATVSTMLKNDGMKYMGMYRRSVRDLSVQFGEATDTLSQGLYDILSSSVAPTKALDVLRTSVKAAKAGVTDTAVAVDGITSLLNAYGLAAEKATDVSDLMFATVKSGKLNFESLANNIGKVAPMARAAGMSIEDMMAAIATLTRQGLSTEEATTRLVNILKAMPAAAGELLQTVRQFEGQSLEDILKVVPNARAAGGLATLAADINGLRRDMELMQNAAGSAEEAFTKLAATPAFKLDQARQQLGDLVKSLGEGATPSVLLFTEELKRNRSQLQAWARNMVRSGTEIAKFVVTNRELVLGLGATAAAFGGLIVLGPPLIGMIKGVSSACLFLAKNPMTLLGVTAAAVVAAFIDWENVFDRIKHRLGIYTSNLKDASIANRESFETMQSEQAALHVKAERLVQLREKQNLTNMEMLEARTLAHDLSKAYPTLADRIRDLGSSASDTADFFKRMNEEAGKHVQQQLKNQLAATERLLVELEVKAKKAQAAQMLISKSAFDVYKERGGKIYSDPFSDLWNFTSNGVTGGAFPKMGMGGDIQKIQDEIDANKELADSYDTVQRQIADAKDEIKRLRDILTEPAKAAATEPTFLDIVKERLEQLPSMIQRAGKALSKMSQESIQKDISTKNADQLHNLKVVQARGIADELARETEQIRLAYEKRIEIARKAGQDIKLLEQARDMEIAQARVKAEQEQAKERTSRAKGLASEIARLWINTTKKGLEREMELLKLSQKEDLAAAKNDKERAMILWKYELLRQQAKQDAQSQIPDRISIGAVDRGFLTQAPGQYDPYRDAQKKQEEIAKNTDAAAKASEAAAKALEAALPLLAAIVEKINTTQKVADF